MTGPKQPSKSLLTGGQGALKLDPEIEAKIRALKLELDIMRLRESFLKPDPSFLRSIKLTSPIAGAAKPPTPLVPRGKGPPKPRPGKAGDLISALMGVPTVKLAVENIKGKATDRLRRDWKRLSTGGKVATISTAVLIGGGGIAGILSHDKGRQEALEFIQGKNIPVPGVTGLTFSISPLGKDKRFMLNFDLAKFLRSHGK